jgi:hypothetical protein
VEVEFTVGFAVERLSFELLELEAEFSGGIFVE